MDLLTVLVGNGIMTVAAILFLAAFRRMGRPYHGVTLFVALILMCIRRHAWYLVRVTGERGRLWEVAASEWMLLAISLLMLAGAFCLYGSVERNRKTMNERLEATHELESSRRDHGVAIRFGRIGLAGQSAGGNGETQG